MHAPMMKGIETDMPDDIKQFTDIEESRVRGIEHIAKFRAEIMKDLINQDPITLAPFEMKDILEAWEDLVTRAETPDATNSKIADLEQECDRLRAEADKYRAGNEELNFALRLTTSQANSLDEESKKLREAAILRVDESNAQSLKIENLKRENALVQISNKELRKELSVLRRALNAANGVIGHFTGRK